MRRSVTDLAGVVEATSNAVREAPRIGARTLLPLARHVAASLAASAAEVPDADHAPSVVEPAATGVTAVAAMAAPNLPAATQAQVAQLLADLLRRLTPNCRVTENARAERHDGL